MCVCQCATALMSLCHAGGSSSTIRRCVPLRNLPKTWGTSTSTGEWLTEVLLPVPHEEEDETQRRLPTLTTLYTVAPRPLPFTRFTSDSRVNTFLKWHINTIKWCKCKKCMVVWCLFLTLSSFAMIKVWIIEAEYIDWFPWSCWLCPSEKVWLSATI